MLKYLFQGKLFNDNRYTIIQGSETKGDVRICNLYLIIVYFLFAAYGHFYCQLCQPRPHPPPPPPKKKTCVALLFIIFNLGMTLDNTVCQYQGKPGQL